MKLQELQKRKTQALSLHRRGAYRDAISLYRELLEQQPDDADTLSNLGSAYRSLKRPELAVLLYRRALELKDSGGYRFNLANALKDLYRFAEAITIYRELLSLDPENDGYQFNLAVAYRDSGDHRSALDVLSSLNARHPSRPDLHWEMAQNYLRLGNYRNGWRYFESRWELGKIALPNLDVQLWRGEPLAGKNLLVVAEQGYGDTLLMARYILQLVPITGSVALLCKPELDGLFSGAGISCVASQNEVAGADYFVPIMSLPRLLDPDNSRLPEPLRFSVDSEKEARFRKTLSPSVSRPNVGIVWSGSVTFQNNHNRSMGLRSMLRLLSPFDVRLYSFQKGEPLRELQEIDIGKAIVDAGSHCRDFSDTAAALQSMDFIVMTDSSVAHLAASLGKPVINLLDYASYWLYGTKGLSTPWYPSMQLVRQKVPGDWGSLKPEFMQVVAGMIDNLCKPGTFASGSNCDPGQMRLVH